MARNLYIIVLAFLINCNALGEQEARKSLIRDGFALTGVDGKLSARGQKWQFEFSSNLSDGRAVVKKGSALELLPSSGLEKMVAGLAEHPGGDYRLYNAIVTRYEGENYIYPDYFLPLAGIEEPTPAKPEEPNKPESRVTINEPNDVVIIPQEIIDKLSTSRIIRPEKLTSRLELKQDSILANRTGFIAKQQDGKKIFVFDAFGRNYPKISLDLLPCQILERAEQKQAREPERLRFRVSGIVTKYKGRYYLLLQQATRVYSYGNFSG